MAGVDVYLLFPYSCQESPASALCISVCKSIMRQATLLFLVSCRLVCINYDYNLLKYDILIIIKLLWYKRKENTSIDAAIGK